MTVFGLRDNPHRLAWTVMLVSFCSCVGLGVGVPSLVFRLVRRATVPVEIRVEATQPGTVLLYLPSQAQPVGITDRSPWTGSSTDGTELATGDSDQGQVTVMEQRTHQVLVGIQMYAVTNIRLEQASSPRFQLSSLPYQVQLKIKTGRIRLNIVDDLPRRVSLDVHTPDCTVTITQPGRYSVETTDRQSTVVVQDGEAMVWDSNREIQLTRDQRAVSRRGGSVDGALPAPSNLVVNGDFAQPWQNGWKGYSDAEVAGDSRGVVTNLTLAGGRPAVGFQRLGLDHGETGIIQTLNRDIRDFRRLELHLDTWIASQDVPLCGSLGSECPIMVELKYRDVANGERSWFQGFYTDPGNSNIFRCIMCSGPSNLHRQIQRDTLVSFDSGNLMSILKEVGPPPATLLFIRIYASGHSWNSAVTNVELIAEE